ncbi:MAG: aminotransferase class V-fold PLP-dependent enzyme, partial [Acidobacteriaceae bacterium]|nr:aminotransferase class V-fold PLP-dependent enzyme [Acidobacteriaceae bacterium]
EFPNQLYAAQSLSGVRGVECQWEVLEEHVTSRTRVVLLSTVDYVTGRRPHLLPVIRRLRERGILVYIDGTQSLGALRFDCASIQPDFLAVDAYKWMISPNGAGLLYVAPEVRQWLRPNVIGWRSDREWRNVDSLHHGAPRFSESAEKYEGGMPAFSPLYAMQASLELMHELGADVIEARVLELAACAREALQSLGADLDALSGDYLPSQIVAVRFPGADASLLARQLAEQNIIVSARRGYFRVSPHFYNNEDDVSMLRERLRTLL